MWTRIRTAALWTACLFAAVPSAKAADYGMGLRAGTQGFGAEFGVGLNKRVSLRGGLYGASVSGDYDDTDITYDADLKLGGIGALVDVYPMKGGFHLSAGLFSNANEADIVATPTGPVEIGGVTYPAALVGTLRGEIEFDSTAPYFGVGWGRLTAGKRLGFLCDLGLLKQGSGDVSLTSSSGLVTPGDLEAERQEIEDDIEDYDFWPVISLGMAIRF